MQSIELQRGELKIKTISRPALLMVASTSSTVAPNIDTKEASDELISLLMQRRRGSSTEDDEERICSLVDTLTSAKVHFDPTMCLDGPLYVSNVVEGPPPLWERFGMRIGGTEKSNNVSKGSFGNIQGQQYRYRDNNRSVVNYAEILGKAFHVRAYGTYERDADDANDTSRMQQDAPSPLDNVLALFRGPSPAQASNLIRCPADFVVTVTTGSFFVLGQRLDIPIAGTGYLRVLYADENLRIFVSPKSTTDDRWEKAGLKVAQINIKYFTEDGEFEDLCAASE